VEVGKFGPGGPRRPPPGALVNTPYIY
jgi:hypothetical protein